jgi:hypothetical protein
MAKRQKMPPGEEYKFKIDAYTPDTIPMVRLSEYMAKLAALLGSQESVHFVRLAPGSTVLVHKVAREAVPKVRERVQASQRNDAPRELRQTYGDLNRMLRLDNAVGTLARGRAKILKFPGREQKLPEAIGPFNQQTMIEGQLMRAGGIDDTAHALIRDAEQRVWSCEVTHELAKELAPYLYGKPLRLHGIGRWFRERDGVWDLKTFKASGFEVLGDETLQDAVARLRKIQGGEWSKDDSPLDTLKKIRGDNGSTH